MNKRTVLAELNKIKGIYTPPTILNEILSAVNNPDMSNNELSEIILKDPSLTASVLKIANSSFYGIHNGVTSVNKAVMVMGVNAVKLFVLSISVFNQVNAHKHKSKLNERLLWTHFLEVASASRKIAEYIKYNVPEEAYVAGLLHDIGIILLENNFPDEYIKVRKLAEAGIDMCVAEKKIFGIDHQEVAGYVTERWKMPKTLREPLSNHHLNNEDKINILSNLGKIVALADCIAQAPFDELNKLNSTEKRIMALSSIASNLKIGTDILMEIHKQLPNEVIVSASAMDLDMGDAVDILAQSNTRLFSIYLELVSLIKGRQEISRKIIIDERNEGTLESLKIALASLSHYINNATMNIHGKCEILQMLIDKNDNTTLNNKLPESLISIQQSIKKISLVLEELANISSVENLDFFNCSKAIDIENKIREKLSSQFEKVEVES